MLRPPTSGGRGESDVHDYDDVEIPAKRGSIDDDAPTGSGDERPTPGNQPAEGRPDMRLPGAETDSEIPGGSGDDLPQRLGQRIENGSSSSIAPGGTDLLPDVEPPDTTM